MLLAQAAVGIVLTTPVLLVIGAVGLWLVFQKRENRRVRSVGAAFVLLAVLGGAMMVVGFVRWQRACDGLELNPIASDQDIVGTWREDGATIVFLPDHTFTLMAKTQSHGKWELNVGEFFGARMSSPGAMIVGNEDWHAVTKHGELRLVRNAPFDWDEWNGDLGFGRE